jgi:hypothetical protein
MRGGAECNAAAAKSRESARIRAEPTLGPSPIGHILPEHAGFGVTGEQGAERRRGMRARSPFLLRDDDHGLPAVVCHALRLAGQRALDQLREMGSRLVDGICLQGSPHAACVVVGSREELDPTYGSIARRRHTIDRYAASRFSGSIRLRSFAMARSTVCMS